MIREKVETKLVESGRDCLDANLLNKEKPNSDFDDKFKATIMMPAYNVEKYLATSIESALKQTFSGKYEILIINDGSTDGTRDIAEFYQKKYPNVRVLNQENFGVQITRNRLLEEAKGAILLGLDSDDKIYPQALETIVNFFNKHGDVGFVYTDQDEIGENGSPPLRSRERAGCHEHFRDLIYHSCFASHLRAYNRRSLNGHRFKENLSVAEDWDFLLQILPDVRIAHIPKILYSYRINQDGLSITRRDDVINLSKEVLQNHIEKEDIYGDRNVKVIPAYVKDDIISYNHIYYEHEVDGELVLNPKKREILTNFLKQ